MTLEARIGAIHAAESRRALARLTRLLGDLDRAEDALQAAFEAAMVVWPRDGVPTDPGAWLVTIGRNKGIDTLRRQIRGAEIIAGLDTPGPTLSDPHLIRDDQLRLIFTCCHPALPMPGRVALALKVVGGLSVAEIARSFGVAAGAMKRRLTRAKARIRDAGLPYAIPGPAALPERLHGVLQVVYLIYTEGHSASVGDAAIRRDLTRRAIGLARLIVDLMPEPEATALLALLLLNEARMPARCDADGELIPLDRQDRALWDQALIQDGLAHLAGVMASGRLGVFGVQAAIASVHAAAPTFAATRWDLIVGYYDILARLQVSPFVELNRAIAVGMRDGPTAGLARLELLGASVGEVPGYHAARADLARRAGQLEDAREAYRAALERTRPGADRRYLARQLDMLE